MKIGREEEQAMRLAARLVELRGRGRLSELAAGAGMSTTHAAKVLAKLRDGGVVEAFRGRKGGYELRVPLEELSASMVLKALGHPLLRGCRGLSGSEPGRASCPSRGGCAVRPVWQHLATEVNRLFEQTVLVDLVSAAGRSVDQSPPKNVGVGVGKKLQRG